MQIIVCGSSSGIGLSLTKHLRKERHKVWGIARRKTTGKHSCCDLTYYQSAAVVAKMIHKDWKVVDAIIVCAGVQPIIGKTLQADDTAWHAGISGNLCVAFNALRAFTPLMDKCSARPKIIVFSGGGATKARPYFSSYACAKTAIVRLVETVAAEEPTMDVNAIAPGIILTDMTRAVLKAGPKLCGDNEVYDATEAAKTGGDSMERLCELVDFLLSGESNGISGRLISAQHDNWKEIRALKDWPLRFKLRRTT